MLISKRGREYREQVIALVWPGEPLTTRLAVEMLLYPPDRRRRDIDNTAKALLDALQHAGVYTDDSQIDRLVIERGPLGGYVEVSIAEAPRNSGQGAHQGQPAD
jgi:crossover junction endodeoxyribonuclease RusA